MKTTTDAYTYNKDGVTLAFTFEKGKGEKRQKAIFVELLAEASKEISAEVKNLKVEKYKYKVNINSKVHKIETELEFLSYEFIMNIMGEKPETQLTVTYHLKGTNQGGNLFKGQKVELSNLLIINAVKT